MVKKLFVFLSLCVALFAIQIDIHQDRNLSISNEEVQAFRDYVKDMTNFVLNEKGAKKLVKENRVLALEYLQKPLSSYDRSRIRVMVEDYLAKALVDRFQNKILNTDPKILYSYYLEHIDKYKKSDTIDLVIFVFKDYQKAQEFYEKVKNIRDLQKIQKEAKNAHALDVKELENYPVARAGKIVKSFLDPKRSDYFLPPIVFSKGNVRVIFVHRYHVAKDYEPFEKVKEKVKRDLFQEAYLRYREKLVKKVR